jgi:ABC-type multidrug transport system fused ATPase/permease subunit
VCPWWQQHQQPRKDTSSKCTGTAEFVNVCAEYGISDPVHHVFTRHVCVKEMFRDFDALFAAAQGPKPLPLPTLKHILNNRHADSPTVDVTVPLLEWLTSTPLGKEYLRASPFRLAADLCAITSPLIVRALINSQSHSLITNVLLAIILLALQLAATVSTNLHLQKTMRVAWIVKGSLLKALFEHAMLVGSAEGDRGKLVNLFETDPTRIELALGSMHMLYAAPLMIFMTATLLAWSLGFAGMLLQS